MNVSERRFDDILSNISLLQRKYILGVDILGYSVVYSSLELHPYSLTKDSDLIVTLHHAEDKILMNCWSSA